MLESFDRFSDLREVANGLFTFMTRLQVYESGDSLKFENTLRISVKM